MSLFSLFSSLFLFCVCLAYSPMAAATCVGRCAPSSCIVVNVANLFYQPSGLTPMLCFKDYPQDDCNGYPPGAGSAWGDLACVYDSMYWYATLNGEPSQTVATTAHPALNWAVIAPLSESLSGKQGVQVITSDPSTAQPIAPQSIRLMLLNVAQDADVISATIQIKGTHANQTELATSFGVPQWLDVSIPNCASFPTINIIYSSESGAVIQSATIPPYACQYAGSMIQLMLWGTPNNYKLAFGDWK